MTQTQRQAMPVAPTPDLRFEVYKDSRRTGRPVVGVTYIYAFDVATDKGVGLLAFCNKVHRKGTSYEMAKGEIYDVRVDADYQRRGVATALLAKARRVEPRVHHSQNLSDEGRAWSQVAASKDDVQIEVKESGPLQLGDHTVVARIGGEIVGRLSGGKYNAVEKIWVDPAHRRKGIATKMYRALQEKVGPMREPDDFTDSGSAWFSTVGNDPRGYPSTYGSEPNWSTWMKNAAKESLPSWRDRGERPQAEAVIVPDQGRGRRNSYEVFLYGQPHGRRGSFEEAKTLVEEIYGPLEWAKVPGDTNPHNDPVHGQTRMFNDAPHYWVADRLPRLGTTASAETFELHEVDISAVSSTRCVAAFVNEDGYLSPIGFMTWDRATGTTEMIYVDEEFRGRGLSTRLLKAVEKLDGGPLNATGEFTEAGEAWARHHGFEPVVEHRLSVEDMKAMSSRLLVYISRSGKKIRRLGAAGDGDEIQYTVRVEFGRRRDDAQPTEEGPNSPAYLDVNAGERYVTVWARSETEARLIASEMVASGSDSAQNPVGQTGDMPTKAEVVRALAGASGGLPEGVVFEEEWDLPNLLPNERVVSATLDGRRVGWLVWEGSGDGRVNVITVEPQWRRRGIGTRLFEEAKKRDSHVRHDPNEGNIRPDGKEWIKSLAAAPTLEHWRPTSGMFARGQDTLDPRLFDIQTEEMLPAVRQAIMATLEAYWGPKYGDWGQWAKVYLAGSGSSYWWDSDADLDILIGVDLERLRQARPANREVADDDILAHLNKGLTEDLRPTTTGFLGGQFEATWFVNAGAYDIRALIPYAAYDVGSNEWVVHPPVLPANWGPESIPEEIWRRVEQTVRSVQEVLSLPEPERTIAGAVMFNAVHEERRASYSAHGGGWLSYGNVVYQALSQHPQRLLRQLYLCKHPDEVNEADVFEKVASGAEDERAWEEQAEQKQWARKIEPAEFEALCQRVLDAELGRRVKIEFDLLYAPREDNGWTEAAAVWMADEGLAYIGWSMAGMDEGTALHECAHVIAGYRGNDDGHGPHWRSVYRSLLSKYAPSIRVAREARVAPQVFGGFDGPLARRFNSYDQQSQRDIRAAVDALEEGRLAEPPDPKKGPLKGLYTIPVGALSESSTSERLLVAPTPKGWVGVYYLPMHNYDQAERDIEGWRRALSRQGTSRVPDPNWVRAFYGTGQANFEGNKPYIGVGFRIPAFSSASIGLSREALGVPIPWEGDLRKSLAEAERKAKAFYHGADKDLYERWLGQGGYFYLIVGSTVRARMVGTSTTIGNWKEPSSSEAGDAETLPGFLSLVQSNPKKAFERVCVEVADAQPPGYVSHPLFDPAKVRKTLIYRGMTLEAGQDPLTSTHEIRGGVGSSWTLDLNTAKAVAERGGAGFSGDNNRGGQTVKWTPGRRVNKDRPVVIRAEVDLTKDGVALFTDGRMYYVSEQEVNVDPGTEVKITGVVEAEKVIDDPKEKAEAERQIELAKRTQYKEGDAWATYSGHYRWPGFKSVNIKRTADYNWHYYAIDWAWQAELDRQAGGRGKHDLTKTRTMPLLERLARQILDEHGHPESKVKVVLIRSSPGMNESEAEFEWNPSGQSVLTLHIGNDMRTKWVVLHEMAHGLDLVEGGDEAVHFDNHGPRFVERFDDLLRGYGMVDIDLTGRP